MVEMVGSGRPKSIEHLAKQIFQNREGHSQAVFVRLFFLVLNNQYLLPSPLIINLIELRQVI